MAAILGLACSGRMAYTTKNTTRVKMKSASSIVPGFWMRLRASGAVKSQESMPAPIDDSVDQSQSARWRWRRTTSNQQC